MDEKEVFEKIRIILADILEMAPNEISRDSSLLDDLGIESVDLLNINLKIENAFHILDEVHDIEGAMIILGDKIGTWGTLPQLLKTHIDTQLITHGR